MGGDGETRSGGLQLSSEIFRVKYVAHKEAPLHSNYHKTYVAKSMAYIINQLCCDFQQGGCLYKPTSGIQWTLKHLWTSDRPQKQAFYYFFIFYYLIYPKKEGMASKGNLPVQGYFPSHSKSRPINIWQWCTGN